MTLPPAPPAVPEIAAYELLDLPVALADAQGRLLAVNAAFADFTGYDSRQAAGQRLDELLCGASDGVMRLWLGQRLRAAQGFGPLDFCGHDAQGQPLRGRLGLRTAGHPPRLQVLTLQPGPAPMAWSA